MIITTLTFDQISAKKKKKKKKKQSIFLLFPRNFGSQRSIRLPSPAFNREPTCKVQQTNEPVYGRIVRAPSPSQTAREDAEDRARQAREQRLREHREHERQEKLRLEEILATCAEYERLSLRDDRYEG